MSYKRRDKQGHVVDLKYKELEETGNPYFTQKRESIFASRIRKVDSKFLKAVFVSWIALLYYFERIEVARYLNQCQWSLWENWPQGSEAHRIAFLADPQIVDDYSYEGRPALFNYFIKKIADNYLHRNHRFTQELLDPHTIIFLGDLFDGGREWDDEVWLEEYSRFQKVFPESSGRKTINIIAGNHDIGFEKVDHHVLNRFKKYFGNSNDLFELGNHSLVFLDTISLSHPDPVVNSAPKMFLETINNRLDPKLPRIILSHVPFYRFNENSPCGPLREKQSPFPIQKGKQYQTVIEYDISQNILSSINPVLLFAGDDHDYCDINQFFTFQDEERIAREIAAKSCAMTSGIKSPAIQLLSLNNPVDIHSNSIDVNGHPISQSSPINDLRYRDSSFTYKTELCYMPNPYKPLRFYGLFFALTQIYLGLKFLFPGKYKSFKRVFSGKYRSNQSLEERNASAFYMNNILSILLMMALFSFYF